MRRALAAGCFLAVLAEASASAQGLLVDVHAGKLSLNAADTAKAVFDSSGGLTVGGSAGWVFGRGFFVAFSGRHFSKDGQRVFVADPAGEVFKLGHPLSVSLTPLELSVGYRFRSRGLFTPYLGAGGGRTSYSEESTVGGVAEKESYSKTSWHAKGGVEVLRGRLRLAAELHYSSVPDAIGVAGVSKVYGETDLGGLSLLGKLVWAPKAK